MKAAFPSNDSDVSRVAHDHDAEAKMELIMGIITGIRNVRGEMEISPSLFLDVSVQSQDEEERKTIEQHHDIIINLARLKTLSVEQIGKRPKAAATNIVNGSTIFVSLEGVIDFDKEAKRLEKEIGKLTNDLKTVSMKLANEDFLNKAPAQVVDKVKEKNSILVEKQQKLQKNLIKIRELETE
jgi:valyl-tRNA synthetase